MSSTSSSATPPAGGPPERWFAAYDGGKLVLVFRPGPGPVRGAGENAAALLEHPGLNGRFMIAGRRGDLLEEIRTAPSPEALSERLRARGFEVRATPASALAWAL